MQLLRRQSLLAHIATRADDFREHVVRQLHALDARAVLDAKEAAGDERVDEWLRDAGEFDGGLERDVVAEAGLREQVIFDEGAHARRQVGDAAVVKIVEDFAAVAGDEVGGDLRLAE